MRRILIVLILVIGLAAIFIVARGRAQQTQPAGNTAGQKVDNALGDISRGLNEVGSAVRSEWDRARQGVQNMGTQARVYSRLHWDKALNSSDVTVNVPTPGTVLLSGNVPNTEAKSKAVKLAQETVGVSQVNDQLTVPAATAP